MDRSMVLAIVFFVTTIVLSVVLAFKFTKKKKPVWARNTRKIIGKGTDAPPELKVMFSDLPVDAVYQSVFLFFNKGTETIRKSDVAEAVAVQFKGAKILRQPAILAASREANKLSVRHLVKNGSEAIEIDFLYLDHDDGVVVEVFHNKSEKIVYSGIIMGANEIRYVGEFHPYRRPRWSSILYVVMGVALGISFGFLLPGLIDVFGGSESRYAMVFAAISIGFLAIGFGRLFAEEVPSVYRRSKFPEWTRSVKLPWTD